MKTEDAFSYRNLYFTELEHDIETLRSTNPDIDGKTIHTVTWRVDTVDMHKQYCIFLNKWTVLFVFFLVSGTHLLASFMSVSSPYFVYLLPCYFLLIF